MIVVDYNPRRDLFYILVEEHFGTLVNRGDRSYFLFVSKTYRSPVLSPFYAHREKMSVKEVLQSSLNVPDCIDVATLFDTDLVLNGKAHAYTFSIYVEPEKVFKFLTKQELLMFLFCKFPDVRSYALEVIEELKVRNRMRLITP